MWHLEVVVVDIIVMGTLARYLLGFSIGKFREKELKNTLPILKHKHGSNKHHLKKKQTWSLLLSFTCVKDLLCGVQNLLIYPFPDVSFKELAKGLGRYLICFHTCPSYNCLKCTNISN
jgi:membrane protein YqaA with SNARE-associated domain